LSRRAVAWEAPERDVSTNGHVHSLYGLVFSSAPPMAIAFVLLNVNLGKEQDVLDRLRKTEGVKEAYQVYGMYDIIARLEAESAEKVKGLLQEKIRKIDDVRSSLTMLAV